MSAETADARALHRRHVWGKVGSYTLLTVLAVIVLFPIYITVVNSLLPSREILSQPHKFFPTDPTIDLNSIAVTSRPSDVFTSRE